MNFQHQLLVAMPSMDDPRFAGAVVLVCEHTSSGAMGVVINKPTQQSFGHLCLRMGVDNTNTEYSATPVYFGGPVHPERGLILHEPLGDWIGTYKIGDDIGVSQSRDIFDALRLNQTDNKPNRALLMLGYTGWNAGQLEGEVADNVWLNVRLDDPTALLFETPASERRHQALKALGINPESLSSVVGHA